MKDLYMNWTQDLTWEERIEQLLLEQRMKEHLASIKKATQIMKGETKDETKKA